MHFIRALGVYKLISKYYSEIGNCQQMKQKDWSSFMRTYNWGKFLSQGACKSVYCVKSMKSYDIQAVSIMDVNELRDRDMELAVKQELEVSLLCSSLVSLNICPNLVLVHSIFQSQHPVSDSLWNSKRPCPADGSDYNIIIPKVSKKDLGLYQV